MEKKQEKHDLSTITYGTKIKGLVGLGIIFFLSGQGLVGILFLTCALACYGREKRITTNSERIVWLELIGLFGMGWQSVQILSFGVDFWYEQPLQPLILILCWTAWYLSLRKQRKAFAS